ncbi:MAG TPA: rhomboid family intramembrane serine protease [Flavipsychrobacter sp.]|nr:rhomboid family intramembrane serine protease [Flavipsychrobacter sp.]
MTQLSPGRFNILPPIVKNLIIINSLMVLLQFVLAKFGIDLADYLGLHYWKSELFRPWQFITHLFMHGSAFNVEATIMHLASNMFALWVFGSVLENYWGEKKFLTFYILCGIGAAMCHLGVLHYGFYKVEEAYQIYQQNPTLDRFQLFLDQHIPKALPNPTRINNLLVSWNNDPGSIRMSNESIRWVHDYLYGYTYNGAHVSGIFDEATVGASGAVFGILFAFGYLFPNTLLYLYFFVPVKAKWVVAAYAVFELVAGFRNTAGDNVAHFAHLGGMLVAFIILKIWYKKRKPIY